MIKFKYEGSVRTGFASIGRELGPGEEFDVPEPLALSFDGHGHCTCLEPEKLAPLYAAEQAAQAEQDALRASSGLVNAHPLAPQSAPAPAEAPAAEAPSAAGEAEPKPQEAGPSAAAAPKRPAKSAVSATPAK